MARKNRRELQTTEPRVIDREEIFGDYYPGEVIPDMSGMPGMLPSFA